MNGMRCVQKEKLKEESVMTMGTMSTSTCVLKPNVQNGVWCGEVNVLRSGVSGEEGHDRQVASLVS